MKIPLIIVNFKTNEQGTAEKALELAKICDKVAKDTKANIAVVVQASDIYRISSTVSIPIIAQHIDAIDYGSHTGFVLAESVKQNGAVATLLNHSEHQLEFDVLEKSIKRAKEVGLVVICCADTPEKAEKVAALNPDFIAIEPPEYIGKHVSVSSGRPEIIPETIAKVKNIPVLCGAGVRDKKDVSKAIELGSKGILVATGVVKVDDHEAALRDIVSGL